MVDLCVMGGGIFGLSVAYACQSRGAKVTLREKRAIGAGSSGGMVGALAPHTPDNWNDKKEFQFQSLIAMEDYWGEVDGLSGISSGYGRTGRIQSIPDERVLNLAHNRTEWAKDIWKGYAEWTVVEADDWGDWAPDTQYGKLILDTLSARMNPRLAAQSLAAAFKAKGGQIEISDEAPSGLPVVWATGYEGLETLSRELDRNMGYGVKGQSILLNYDARDKPHLFADGLHIVPHENGTLAIGSTNEKDFTDAVATDGQIEDVYARAVAAIPILKSAPILGRWAGVRPRAMTRAPLLGAHPTRDGHFVANGGFKIGFGVSIKVGDVMADLILDGKDNIPSGFRLASSDA
ncbi:MAG: NAD(P)/FAD-dependent oxidoreductase [Halocynthiibacter sp.]